MKRYALFVGETYYPAGGWNDFVGFFDTLEEAKTMAVEPENDAVSGWWFNIVDLTTGVIVVEDADLESRWLNRPREPEDPNNPWLKGDEECLYIQDGVVRLLKGQGV